MEPKNTMDELMQLLGQLIALQGGGSMAGQYMQQPPTQQLQTVSPPTRNESTGSVGGIPGLLQDYLGGFQNG